MTEHILLFAQLDGLNPLNSTVPATRTTGLLFKDVLVIVATGLALGLLLLLWARSYVKRKKRRHHHDRKAVSHSVPAVSDQEDEEEHHHHSRRRRKRRREHRPRNPTLAETGGLPTTKTEPSPNPPL
jgi:ABC-type nickel/cobalt efflux system permease component RcnA